MPQTKVRPFLIEQCQLIKEIINDNSIGIYFSGNRAKKSNVEIFHLYFLKWDISFPIPNKLTKLFVANLETLSEGIMSRIFYLRLSSNFMTKNRKLFACF